MTAFIKGIELSRTFYQQAVKPILDKHVPELMYSAALIGSGSEVLGYDTEMSSDHHWGPRVMLFLSADDKDTYEESISQIMSENLPYTFRGYSTHFGDPQYGDGDNGTQLMETLTEGAISHRVEMDTIDNFMNDCLGLGSHHALTPADWLSIPQQKLLSFTAGDVFHDALGLQAIREQFAVYPHDIWLYLLACGWSRIGQDEHLAPRAGYVGDELGSAVMAGRLVRSIMQLCFLMEKQYAPYPKWFGTAFAELNCATPLTPLLRRVQTGDTYRQREEALAEAYTILNTMHNTLNITPDISPAVSDFHGRPFIVSNGWRYSEALSNAITDDAVKAIAQRSQIGSIDQFSDNTDMRESVHLRSKIVELYS
jgi:hypothetical protein